MAGIRAIFWQGIGVIFWRRIELIAFVNIIKGRMRINKATGNQCDLCYQCSQDQRVLLSALHRKIKKLCKESSLQPCQYHLQDQDSQGFARLVRAIRASQPPRSRFHPHCLHLKWVRLLKKSLGCSIQRLDHVCHLAANKISQRNYHLYLLQTQVKQVAQTAEKTGKSEEPQVVKQQHFEESIDIEEGRAGGTGEKGEILMVGTEPSLQYLGLNKLITSGKQLGDQYFNSQNRRA